MSRANEHLRAKLRREIEYYAAQNENLREELSYLDDTFRNNRARFGILQSDLTDSEEMIRVLKLLTR